MFYEKAFLINNTDMVAAHDIFEAKAWWLKNQPKPIGKFDESIPVRVCDLDNDGIFVEMDNEKEILEYIRTIVPGGKLYFERREDGLFVMFVPLRQALKLTDATEPYLIARMEVH